MRGSEFVFDDVRILYFKCHQIDTNFAGSSQKVPIVPFNKKMINVFNML